MQNFPALPDYLLVFLFGIFVPFVSGIRSASMFREMNLELDTASKRKFYLGNSLFLFLMAFVVLLVWWLYHRPFTEIGFQRPHDAPFHLQWWLAAVFIILYLSDSFLSLRTEGMAENLEQLQAQTPFMPTRWVDMPAYTVMCVAAGVGEEIVFRGYLVTFFKYIFRGFTTMSTLAVLVPAGIFSIAHFYQGGKTVFKILVLSVIFGMLFWYTGSLFMVMALHFGVDLLGGLLSLYVIRRNG